MYFCNSWIKNSELSILLKEELANFVRKATFIINYNIKGVNYGQ